jgi:type I restriction enzyme S subunit
LPDGWAWERLSNLASFSGGKTPSTSRSEYWDGDILWVTSKDMKSKYITSSQLRLSTLGAEQMQMYQPDTLLLVTRSGILRHTLPVAILKECATINQDLKAIILYMPQLAEYIYVCLKGMETQLLLKYTKSGTTVENVNFDEFQKVLLPIPSIQQIDRIMSSTGSAESVVSTIEDDKAALADYVIKAKSKILDLAIRGQLVPQDPADEPAAVLLERIRAEKEELIKQGKLKRDKKESVIFRGEDNSYYEKIGTEVRCIDDEIPFDIPDTWEWVRLENCCSKEIRRGKSPKYIDESGILVFAQKCNNKHNGIDIDLALYLDESILGRYPADEYMQDGDIVVNSTGTGTLGRVGFYRTSDNNIGLPIVPDSHVTVIRGVSSIHAFYLYAFMKANQRELEKKGEGSTNQKELKPLTLKEMLVPIPPFSEQKQIEIAVSEALSLIGTIEKSLS